jgi:hypothetical protein
MKMDSIAKYVLIGLMSLSIAETSLCSSGNMNTFPVFSAKVLISTKVMPEAGTTNVTSNISREEYFYCSNGWWQIVSKFQEGFDKNIPTQFIIGTVVNCRRIPNGIRYITSNGRTASNSLPAAIAEPISFPPPEMNDLLACWLALCPDPSLPFLNDWEIQRLNSVRFLQNSSDYGTFSIAYLEPDGGFVSKLYITNNGLIQMADGTVTRLDRPYNHGYCEFAYRTLATTNFNGVIFPLHSVLYKYITVPNAKTAEDLFPAVISDFRLQTIQIGGEPIRTAPLIAAFDKRITNAPRGGLVYLVTNDIWPAATNGKLVQLATTERLSQARYDANQTVVISTKRAIIIAILLVAALSPLVGLIWKKSKNK